MPFAPVTLDAFPQRSLTPQPSFQPQSEPGVPPTQPLLPDLTVREDHTDELVITEHPVEQGANITDHSYKAPSQLLVRYGWSNADEAAAGNPNYVNDFYATMLAIQASRVPQTVQTGKRLYKNMLIASLKTHTDEETATTLFAEVRFQEIIIVQTQLSVVGNPTNMANPAQNSPPSNSGTMQLTAAPNFNFSAYDAAIFPRVAAP